MPYSQKQRILIGTTIRKPPEILEWYLASLARLEIPKSTEVQFAFVLDEVDPTAELAVKAFMKPRVSEHLPQLLLKVQGDKQDYADNGPVTHHWTPNAMDRVAASKNQLIQHALRNGFDAIFFVDADLILEPRTLVSLDSLKMPITCAVYWTRWMNSPQIHAAPQVWMTHPYGFVGRGILSDGEFRAKLLTRNPLQVWGQGACTLIRREVLEKGVDFTRLPDLPTEGMWAGEDRHFCVKAERLHIPMIADPWPDIFHIYHMSDIPSAKGWFDALGETLDRPPQFGDLVNVTIEALESGLQTRQGYIPMSKPIRGRLGQLKLLPEIHDAICAMTIGETRTVVAHIGADYPLEAYRLTRRLFRVTLVDAKPFRLPPVVRDEVYQWTTGTQLDGTTLTAQQHQGLREEASERVT